MLGQTISHYRILEHLGSGGMGDVYLGLDQALERRVALKFLKDEIARDGRGRTILAEARAAAAVDHPFVCKVYEVVETERQAFIVFEYVGGATVQQRIEHGPLPVDQAIKYVLEVAEALGEVHARAFVHLDVKPPNIMITKNGHVKLMDFGVARSTLNAGRLELESASRASVGGTPAYMAPEQLFGQKVDGRADIFALGITFYEMLTGKHPFFGGTKTMPVSSLLDYVYSPPAPSKVPPSLSEIIARAVRMEATERYSTVEEFSEALMKYRDSSASASGMLTLPKQVIAVLPFADLSDEKDQQYFGDGLAEDILNLLAKQYGLNVVARALSFRFRGSELDLQDVGGSLKATAVVRGSVRKTGDNIRIDASLVNVSDGETLWSNESECRLGDVPSVKQSLAKAIASRLQGTSQKIETQPDVHQGAKPQAYDLYLRGRHCWNQRTPANLLQSVEYYKAACEVDPRYAQPYAGLAVSYVTLAIYGAMRPGEAMPNARRAAEKALSLDRLTVDATAALGCIAAVCDWKWDKAEDFFKEAIAADPKNVIARHWYAIHLLAPLGRFDEAGAELDRIAQLESASPIFLATAGLRYHFERRHAQALECLTKALRLDPALAITHHLISQVYMARGEEEKAIDHATRAVAFSGDDAESLALLACASARSDESRALKIFDELRRRSQLGYVSPVLFAEIHLALGDPDSALDALQQAITWRSTDLIWIRVKPLFDPLRKDPRFLELCKTIGFPIKV